MAEQGQQRLAGGTIGARDLVFFVVAAAAPLTVMAGVAPLTVGFGGVGAPGGYLVAGVVMAVFAIGFIAMSRHVPNAGAFYAYIGRGLGRPVGVGAAVTAVLSYNLICIGLLGAFAYFSAETFDTVLGIGLPWQVWAVVGIVAMGVLGYRQITLSAKVLGVLLGLEVVILLVLAVPVVLQGGEAGLSLGMFSPGDVFGADVGAVFVLTFGAFLGFESTAIYAEETRDARRTIPRATYAAVGFLGLFYTFVVWTLLMAFGPEQAVEVASGDGGTEMFFTAMERWVGAGAADVMRLLIITSAFAATLAFHNACARYQHALGREGVLPAWLGRTDPETGAPQRASLAQTAATGVVVAAFALAGADPYLELFLWTNGPGILGVLALQALCSFAVVAFFRAGARGTTVLQRAVAPGLAGVGLTVVCVLVTTKLDLLTGASATINWLLLAPLPIVFALGVWRALSIRRRDPAAYERLTTLSVDGA